MPASKATKRKTKKSAKKSTACRMRKYVVPALLIAGLGLGIPLYAASDSASYDKLFISYYSPDNVKSMAKYVDDNQLGGYILWEFRGDTPYDKNSSLLKALNEAKNGQPYIMGYWTNWGVYSNDSSARAIPEKAYGVPGSLDKDGNAVKNEDFKAKLDGMTSIVYSFVEVQADSFSYWDQKLQQQVGPIPNKTPDNIGMLYFNDPWADLNKPGVNATQDSFCNNKALKEDHTNSKETMDTSPICFFALTNRNNPIEPKAGVQMGNFNAFMAIQNQQKNLKKFISIGGYGHDDSFEDTFKHPKGIDNFVNSAKALVTHFNIDGIDLDYENPNMTAADAKNYLRLITALREALPKDTVITIAVLGNPDYLEGKRDGKYGFGGNTLIKISEKVDRINLMTYDFHGAFDFKADQSGSTGFLTNLYIPDDAPKGYRFSVDAVVKKARDLGLNAEKIGVGIPAYGRALAGIDATNDGLFQPVTDKTTIPRGDLDSKSCVTAITPLTKKSCSGSFQYKYIVDKMLTNGMNEQNWQDKGDSNGTTAYADSWKPDVVQGLRLEITNTGSGSDLAFNLSIVDGDTGKFNVPDFMNLSTDKTYEGEQTQVISGKTGLSVKWKVNWGGENDPSGQCDKPLDFKGPMHVMIKVSPGSKTGEYLTTCDFKPIEK